MKYNPGRTLKACISYIFSIQSFITLTFIKVTDNDLLIIYVIKEQEGSWALGFEPRTL